MTLGRTLKVASEVATNMAQEYHKTMQSLRLVAMGANGSLLCGTGHRLFLQEAGLAVALGFLLAGSRLTFLVHIFSD